MIALGPREIAKASAVAASFWLVMHMLDRIIAGYVQCSALGCLP